MEAAEEAAAGTGTVMSIFKGPSEGGSGGKRGHRNMEHWGFNDEVKAAARSRRTADPAGATGEALAPDCHRRALEPDNGLGALQR